MIQKLTVSAVFFGAMILAGCNSDKGTGGGGAIDPANIIGTWIVTGMSLNPGVDVGGVIMTDFFSTFPACAKDDPLIINADHTYSSSEGLTSCVPPTPSETGTWTLTGNVMIMTATGGAADTTHLSSVTATTATMTEPVAADEFGDNTPRTLTITATKQ